MPHSALASLLVGLLAVSLTRGTDTARPAIAVIVGKDSFIGHVSVDDLRELYLRRRRLWPNGMRAIPINLPADNPTRERFTRIVLGRSTEYLVAYWNKQYFEGITPPMVLPSPAAIRAYLMEPGAIAYLPVSETDDTCRIVLLLDR